MDSANDHKAHNKTGKADTDCTSVVFSRAGACREVACVMPPPTLRRRGVGCAACGTKIAVAVGHGKTSFYPANVSHRGHPLYLPENP